MVSVGSVLGWQMPSAQAVFDQTPPSLSVNVRPAFVMGNIVANGLEFDTVQYTTDIAQLIQWSATDDVGVCWYSLYARPAGDYPEAILESSHETQYIAMGGDYNGDFGGGVDVIIGFLLTASDCTGNATTKAIDEHIFVIQEDGTSATDALGQTITYTGAWGQSNCDCFLAGHTAYTTKSGARATFTRTYDQGDEVALVMAEGPGRGAASIRIDGQWLMNIDTYAPINTNRVVVFARTMSAGIHTVAIVNHGTRGRPRVDLDAVLVGRSLAGGN
jgi:hypothetical protein